MWAKPLNISFAIQAQVAYILATQTIAMLFYKLESLFDLHNKI